MVRFKSYLLPMLLVVVASGLFYVGQQLGIQYWAQRTLEASLSQLTSQLKLRAQEGGEFFARADRLLKFDCGEQDRELLEAFEYWSLGHRQAGVVLENGSQCASNYFRHSELERIAVSRLPSGDALEFWRAPGQQRYEIKLAHQFNKRSLYVTLQPMTLTDPILKECQNCFYGELELDKFGVVHQYGDVSVKLRSDLYAYSYDPYLNITLRAWADPRYVLKLKELFGNWIWWGGSALSTLLIFALQWQKRRRSTSMYSLILEGIKNGEFVPYYQPIVDLEQQTYYGCEVLVRWHRANGESIPADYFVPYAEETGLIDDIFSGLFERALIELQSLNWHQASYVASFNVTPQQIEQPGFAKVLIDKMQGSPIQGRSLAIEVTERQPFSNIQAAHRELKIISQHGISLKLDDAGTGYGTFSHLQLLNIDALKIDRLFVKSIGTINVKTSVLNSIIAFAKESRMGIIAEGVETRAQAEFLYQAGVHFQQGYFYGKAMSVTEFKAYLEKGGSPCGETNACLS